MNLFESLQSINETVQKQKLELPSNPIGCNGTDNKLQFVRTVPTCQDLPSEQ